MTFPLRSTHFGSISQDGIAYHNYVHSLSTRWPLLQQLDVFMNDPFGRSIRRGNPRPRVAVLEFSHTGIAPEMEFTSAYDFRMFLDQSAQATRLFLVEDLSLELIEILGGHFDVDPLFFATHLWQNDWYNRHSSPATVPYSYTRTQEQSFHHFRYLEGRPLAAPAGVKYPITRLPCWDSNILRKMTIMNLGSTRQLIGFARRHITIWMKPHDNEETWTGSSNILLVDS